MKDSKGNELKVGDTVISTDVFDVGMIFTVNSLDRNYVNIKSNIETYTRSRYNTDLTKVLVHWVIRVIDADGAKKYFDASNQLAKYNDAFEWTHIQNAYKELYRRRIANIDIHKNIKLVRIIRHIKSAGPLKEFNVVSQWTMTAKTKVMASTIDDAIASIEDMDGLPNDCQYLDDSFNIVKEECN